MIIFDRSVDLVSPFIHDFNYQVILINSSQTMVYDLLDVSKEKEVVNIVHNQYTYKSEKGNGEEIEKTVLLNEADPFWMRFRYLHFATVLGISGYQLNRSSQPRITKI